MEKIKIESKSDINKAVGYFGEQWEIVIKELIEEYPCILIGCYADDIEFGEGYSFTVVNKSDF